MTLLATVALACAPAQVPCYTLEWTGLEDQGGGQSTHITDSNVVFATVDLLGNVNAVIRWAAPDPPQEIPALRNANARVFDATPDGLLVGSLRIVGAWRGFVMDQSTGLVTHVAPQPGHDDTVLYGIDSFGTAVGLSGFGDPWTSPPGVGIVVPRGQSAIADARFEAILDINDAGQRLGIRGSDVIVANGSHTQRIDIPGAEPGLTFPIDMSEGGAVLLQAKIAGIERAVLWRNGVTVLVPFVSGWTGRPMFPAGMNDDGDVVGRYSASGITDVFLYRSGRTHSLGAQVCDVPPGALLRQVTDINANGWIAATLEAAGGGPAVLLPRCLPMSTPRCIASTNSIGAVPIFEAASPLSASAGRLDLVASGLPPATFGFVIAGRKLSGPLAHGGTCVRIGQRLLTSTLAPTGATGHWTASIDTTRIPPPASFNGMGPTEAIQPHSTWYFQLWYRDAFALGGVVQSRLTGALQVTFCD